MKSYEVTETIHAGADDVWAVLGDVERYPDWDSGAERVEGPGKGMTSQGGMPLGLFKGVRTYRLTPAEDGGTRFEMREQYTGPLLPLIWRSMPDLQPSFDKFACGLKARVERGSNG